VQVSHPDEFPPSSRETIRQNLIGAIVDALEESTSLNTQQDLALLVDKLAARIGQRPPPQQPTFLRADFFGLVRYCEQLPDGIGCLSAAVNDLEQGSLPSQAIAQLALEWEALDAQPALVVRWEWLSHLLAQVRPGDLPRLIRSTPEHPFQDLPPYCTTPWSAFLFLLGAATGPDSVPLWMIFLDRLRDLLPPDSAEELWAQNRQWAVAWGLGGDLDLARYSQPTVSERGGVGYIVIQLAPVSIDTSQYTLSYWLQKDPHRWRPEPGLNRHLDLGDLGNLASHVGQVISEAEASWGDRPGQIQLEFVLPMELLNLPVEWLPKNPDSDSTVPLAVIYPVVLRSLERLGRREWHRRWRLRWDSLNTRSATTQTLPSIPAGNDGIDRLEIMLSRDHNHPGVVLSQPPVRDQTGGRALEMALRVGCPLIIWNRSTNGSDPDFRSIVDELQNGGIGNIPDHLAEQRREVAELDPRQRDQHPWYHIAVLWDDPDRKPWSA
jgi:hypothetical protein